MRSQFVRFVFVDTARVYSSNVDKSNTCKNKGNIITLIRKMYWYFLNQESKTQRLKTAIIKHS